MQDIEDDLVIEIDIDHEDSGYNLFKKNSIKTDIYYSDLINTTQLNDSDFTLVNRFVQKNFGNEKVFYTIKKGNLHQGAY